MVTKIGSQMVAKFGGQILATKFDFVGTVKPVYNDYLYYKIYYLLLHVLIQ